MLEVFPIVGQVFVFIQYYQNTIFNSYAWKYFNIVVMFLFHITRLLFYIFILTHLTLSYMILCTKNYPKFVKDSMFETPKQMMTHKKKNGLEETSEIDLDEKDNEFENGQSTKKDKKAMVRKMFLES